MVECCCVRIRPQFQETSCPEQHLAAYGPDNNWEGRQSLWRLITSFLASSSDLQGNQRVFLLTKARRSHANPTSTGPLNKRKFRERYKKFRPLIKIKVFSQMGRRSCHPLPQPPWPKKVILLHNESGHFLFPAKPLPYLQCKT